MTELDYLRHIRGICLAILSIESLRFIFISLVFKGGVNYVKAGGTASIRQERREALQAFITKMYNFIGLPHNPHSIKHDMIAADVDANDAEDVPITQEP